jgi:hypothetical protein
VGNKGRDEQEVIREQKGTGGNRENGERRGRGPQINADGRGMEGRGEGDLFSLSVFICVHPWFSRAGFLFPHSENTEQERTIRERKEAGGNGENREEEWHRR